MLSCTSECCAESGFHEIGWNWRKSCTTGLFWKMKSKPEHNYKFASKVQIFAANAVLGEGCFYISHGAYVTWLLFTPLKQPSDDPASILHCRGPWCESIKTRLMYTIWIQVSRMGTVLVGIWIWTLQILRRLRLRIFKLNCTSGGRSSIRWAKCQSVHRQISIER